ncbi:MAG: hypothetical protein IPM06_17885 [Rhizobiales bacterium]|nr:hypothetical protein [Hyphomicrobiales bacterium]
MTTDSDVKEWKAAMDAGANAIARRERVRGLERRLAIETAVWTIYQECKFARQIDGEDWWIVPTFFDEETRERMCLEYLDMNGLIEKRDIDGKGICIRIRHEDMR